MVLAHPSGEGIAELLVHGLEYDSDYSHGGRPGGGVIWKEPGCNLQSPPLGDPHWPTRSPGFLKLCCLMGNKCSNVHELEANASDSKGKRPEKRLRCECLEKNLQRRRLLFQLGMRLAASHAATRSAGLILFTNFLVIIRGREK